VTKLAAVPDESFRAGGTHLHVEVFSGKGKLKTGQYRVVYPGTVIHPNKSGLVYDDPDLDIHPAPEQIQFHQGHPQSPDYRLYRIKQGIGLPGAIAH
jgi:hypothetical protein